MNNLLTRLITVSLIFHISSCISFRIFKNKQICIQIPAPNSYDFQYISSGQNQQNVVCQIYNGLQKVVSQVRNKSHYKAILNIQSNGSKVCFQSLDNNMKVISFDLVALNDPMRAQIVQKDLNQLYNKIEALYRTMETLYRNQHFYYQRNRVHKQALDHMESQLRYIKIFKILFILVSGFLEFLYVRKYLNSKVGKKKTKRDVIVSSKQNQYKSIPSKN